MCGGCFPDLNYYADIIHRGLTADPLSEEKHRKLVGQNSVRLTPGETTLFRGGSILTLAKHALSPVDYLVVDASGTITYSGSEEQAAKDAASVSGEYETHDLGGRTIVPGFVEPHVHLVFATLAYEWLLNLSPIAQPRLADVTEAISAAITTAAFPNGWICGFGYDPSRMPDDDYPDLTFDVTQNVSPDNPLIVLNSSGHVGYINKVTKQMMIDKGLVNEKQIMEDRNWGKDKDGQPNGVLFEAAIETASQLLLAEFPPLDDLADRAGNVLQRWFSRGVTTIFDGGIGVTKLDQPIWPRIAPTPMRLRASVHGTTLKLADAASNWNLGNQVTVTSAKFWADGSTQGFTALLKDGYPNPPPWVKHSTPDFPDAQTLQGWMTEWYDAGYQLLVHSNGDKATDNVLEAYNGLFTKPPARQNFVGKHRIEHLTIVSEEQIQKIAETNKLSVSHTIGHVYYWGEAFTDYIFHNPDPDPAKIDKRPPRIDPCKSDIDHGVLWSMHSDSPVTPVDPLLYVRTALTRLTQQNGRTLGVEQRVPELVQALEAVTVNPAKQLGMFEPELKDSTGPWIGSLEAGKQADFVVLGEDPREVHFDRIHEISIEETWIGGVKVFSVS